MRDVVFLFGAGASYGAGDIVPEPPPLGTQLYGALSHVYPKSWGAVPKEAKQKFEERNFEDGMEIIYEKYSTAIPQLMREMAVYLIQFRPSSGRSLYSRLARTVQKNSLLPQVLFSTINYDCVLEFSLLGLGRP